jgi:hypothetical protein
MKGEKNTYVVLEKVIPAFICEPVVATSLISILLKAKVTMVKS